jgi:hypothetical protein
LSARTPPEGSRERANADARALSDGSSVRRRDRDENTMMVIVFSQYYVLVLVFHKLFYVQRWRDSTRSLLYFFRYACVCRVWTRGSLSRRAPLRAAVAVAESTTRTRAVERARRFLLVRVSSRVMRRDGRAMSSKAMVVLIVVLCSPLGARASVFTRRQGAGDAGDAARAVVLKGSSRRALACGE